MTKVLILALMASSLLACGETDECRQLKQVLTERQNVLKSAEGQAAALDKVEKRARASEDSTKKLMSELWLDRSESELRAELDKRIAKIPTATITREARAGESEDPMVSPGSETVFVVHFSEPSPTKAFAYLEQLVASPPLVKFTTMFRDKGTNKWRVELTRAFVDQVPITPTLVLPPPAKDLSKIESQFGTCGASDLRQEIADVEAKIAKVAPEAGKITQLLPAAATWEGLGARVELIRDIEQETRAHLNALAGAVLDQKLNLKAIGVEGSLIALEVWGGAREAANIEKYLIGKKLGEMVQKSPTAAPGVARVVLPNTILEARRQRGKQRAQPAEPGPHEHQVPPDHPSRRLKTLSGDGGAQ